MLLHMLNFSAAPNSLFCIARRPVLDTLPANDLGIMNIQLPPLRVPPAPLYNLFTADIPQAKEFRANIVQYNAALVFTSLGVKVDQSVLGHGPPVF